MKQSRKIILGVMTGVCVLTASAAELFKSTKTADFQGDSTITAKEGGIISIHRWNRGLYSAKMYPVDPAKTYKLTGDFCAPSGSPHVFFAFACYDKDGKMIKPSYIFVIPNTFTELAAPVKKGDTVVKVKDASKWKADASYRGIAFNAKKDFSDLPNKSIININKGGIAKNGAVWNIRLQKPAAQDYAAGTFVREQTSGDHYFYQGSKDLNKNWVTIGGAPKGIAVSGSGNGKHFWPGTKFVRVLIIPGNMQKGTVIDFRNVVLEEIK